MCDEDSFKATGANAHFQKPVLGTLATIDQVAFSAQMDDLSRGM